MRAVNTTAYFSLTLGFQCLLVLKNSISQHESAVPIILHVTATIVWSTVERWNTFPHTHAHTHIVNILALTRLASQAILSLNTFVITHWSKPLAKQTNLWVIPNSAFSEQTLNPVFTFNGRDVADILQVILQHSCATLQLILTAT